MVEQAAYFIVGAFIGGLLNHIMMAPRIKQLTIMVGELKENVDALHRQVEAMHVQKLRRDVIDNHDMITMIVKKEHL